MPRSGALLTGVQANDRRLWRWPLVCVAALCFAFAGALLAVAARPLTMADPSESADSPPPTYVVTTGTLGRTIGLSATPRWEAAAFVMNRRAGTVTSLGVLANNSPASPGEVLYTIDLGPVVAAVGAVPAFRELRSGVTGADVEQLQSFLVEMGLEVDVDGAFKDATRRAVQEWQREMGLEPTGVIKLGDIVFLPYLPARLTPDEAVRVGSRLDDGAVAATSFVSEPAFVVSIQPQQTSLFQVGMSVTLGDPPVDAEIAGITEGDDGTFVLALDLIAPCSDLCAALPPGDDAMQVSATIAVVPETEGIVVPVAAVRTDADGGTIVQVLGVGAVKVEVGASADGLVIVTAGLQGGETIVIGP